MRKHSLIVIFLAIAVLLPVVALSQIAEPNVNMVAGKGWPGGDPFLQRQNEPSVAISTRNPLHLLAGANDYRTVDLPGLPDGDERGACGIPAPPAIRRSAVRSLFLSRRAGGRARASA